MEHQAVTTINIGIYQDGTIEQSSLDTMRQLRHAIREKLGKADCKSRT